MSNNNNDVLVIGAVQCPLRGDTQDPLEACDQVIRLMKQQQQASSQSIDLFVLPELAPLGYSEDSFFKYLPNTRENIHVHSMIHEKMMHAAKELNAYICYGTIGLLRKNKFTIRQVVVNHTETVATTIKCCSVIMAIVQKHDSLLLVLVSLPLRFDPIPLACSFVPT